MKQVVNIVRYFTLMLTVSVFLTAQTTVLSFDGMAESFVTGSGGAGNVMLLEDEYGDFVEGEGSMRVEGQLTDMVSWGTWTDISMELGETASLAGYSEMRFKMKILREPVSNARSMQFTCDIFESDGSNDNVIVNNKTGYLNPPSGVIRRNKYNSKPKTNYKYCGSTCATL